MITGPLYDKLKWVALIGMPAFGTLYFTLAQIWDLPYGKEVVGTVVALNTFLGVCLQLSSNQYEKSDKRFDGDMVVTETPVGFKYELELNRDPDDFRKQGEVLFKVKQPSSSSPPS